MCYEETADFAFLGIAIGYRMFPCWEHWRYYELFSERQMKVVNRQLLFDFVRTHADARSSIGAWLNEAEAAKWGHPAEMKQRFPNASLLPAGRVIFNIKGNTYRLDVKINYPSQIVLVSRVATHAEYSKWKF